jgi:outer membrane protein assembly factor BamE (lipoprotein component of BamABCDE complex)|tara:strand:- start:264 stop:659 length:396 start_codon:yes stop_codon:yes gene_type:complete
MKVKFHNPRILLSLICLASLAFAACSGGSANPFAGKDRQVDENIENLMGLAVGMTKNQVYELCGVANYIEGYDWGSVWFYQYRKGNTDGPLAKKEIQQLYMPVVYDNTDRVTGYGQKFYEQTLSDLGTGQF